MSGECGDSACERRRGIASADSAEIECCSGEVDRCHASLISSKAGSLPATATNIPTESDAPHAD